MPTAREVSDAYRAALLKREQAMVKSLIASYKNTYVRLSDKIKALEGEIMALPEAERKAWKVMRLGRWKALRQQVEDELAAFGVIVRDVSQNGHRESIAAGLEFALDSVKARVPAQLLERLLPLWHSLDAAAVESALGFFAEGSPLVAKLNALAPDGAALIERLLTEAVTMGYNPRKWAGAAARGLGQPLPWALNLARTAQLQAYRQATMASYRRNPHIVRGWTWEAAMDSRTCMSCIAMDGTYHSLDEDLDDHYQGRCSAVPVTASWSELGFDIEEEEEARPLARDWFAEQPEAVQRAMFRNNALYEAWRDGRVTWEQLSKETESDVWGRMLVQATYKDIFPPANP